MRQECCLFYPSPREKGSPGGTAHGLAVVLLQGDARAGQLVKVGRDDLLQVQRHQQGVSSTWLCFTLFSVLFIDYIYSVACLQSMLSIMSCHFSGGYFRYIELLIFKIPWIRYCTLVLCSTSVHLCCIVSLCLYNPSTGPPRHSTPDTRQQTRQGQEMRKLWMKFFPFFPDFSKQR